MGTKVGLDAVDKEEFPVPAGIKPQFFRVPPVA
jgi:hypothetical protein